MKAKYINSAHLLDANDKFITTVGGDGVSVYKSSSLRLDRSWALASSKDTPCSISYDTTRKFYHLATAAKDNRSKSSIFSWHQTSDQPSIKAAATLTKLPFSTSIHSIYPLKHSSTPTNAAKSMMDIDDNEQHDDDNHLAAAVSEDGSVAVTNKGKVLALVDCPLEQGYRKLLATSLYTNHKNGEKNFVALLVWQTDALYYWQVVITTHTNTEDDGATIEVGSRYTLLLPEQGDKEKIPSSIKPIAGVVMKGIPVVIFSDGTIATYPAIGTCTTEGEEEEGGAITPVTSRKLDAFTSSFKQMSDNKSNKAPANKKRGHHGGGDNSNTSEDGDTSLLYLSPLSKLNMVAVAGWSEEGLSIALLDVSFVCVQRTLNISLDDFSSSRDTSKPIKVCHIASRDMLVISVGGGIVVVNVQLQKPTLASMVGCMQLSTVSLAGNIEEGKGTLKHVEFSLNMPPNKGSSSNSRSINAPELEWVSAAATVNWKVEQNTSLAKAEHEAVETLAKNGSGGGKGGGSKNTISLQKHVVALIKASKSSGIDISSVVIRSLLQACAESGDWVSVKSLLEHQPPSSLTNCPNLAPLLANSHKYGLLDMLLTSSNGDILSDDLGAVLSSLLSKPSKDAAQAQTEQYKAAKQGAEAAVKAAEDAVKKQKNNAEELMTNAACTAAYVSGFAPSHLALHSLLTVNIDSGLLLGALHHISASQAVALLKYLRIWLSHHDGMLRSVFLLDTASPNSIIVPHLSTVVEWINLTVDSNMTRLMLREDAVGVLSEIKERLVEPQLGEMKGLAAVRGAVEHLQCGAPLAPVRKRVAERYSVEWFDLTVN